jgi:1-deoxy-D-xylulose 5-phosphate reductoisomerase
MVAADEIAVHLFLNNAIGFYDLYDIIKKCLKEFRGGSIKNVSDVLVIADSVKHFIESQIHIKY